MRASGILALPEEELAGTLGVTRQSLRSALLATLVARLQLPDGVECRFGIGYGEIHTVGSSRVGLVQDGSAWWAARDAIEEARDREYSGLRFVRTWFAAADSDDAGSTTGLINAYLLTRDHLVTSMNARNRRLVLGQLLGQTQGELAQREGISQSAVSQALHRTGGAALLAGAELAESSTP